MEEAEAAEAEAEDDVDDENDLEEPGVLAEDHEEDPNENDLLDANLGAAEAGLAEAATDLLVTNDKSIRRTTMAM